MKILFFDCQSGISGNMFLAACIDAGADQARLAALPQQLHLPDTSVCISRTQRNGLAATHVKVNYPESKVHRHLGDICKIIDGGDIETAAKNTAKSIFTVLAQAEAQVHGIPIEKVHFHEVGAVDAIVDCVGASVLWHALECEQAWCGPVSIGGGRVKIAHGDWPVPAPATASLLQGLQTRFGPIDRELVTPTGAAILTTLVEKKQPVPIFATTAVGYGAGDMIFDAIPNVLRLFVGEATETFEQDTATMLACNIDDMNPELYPHILECLLAAGALDVSLTPLLMKKGRPGMQLSVLAQPENVHTLVQLIMRETTSIGVRRHNVQRFKRPRQSVELETPLGLMRFKEIIGENAARHYTPEFEDCRRIADKSGLPLREVYQQAMIFVSTRGTDDTV